MEIKVLPKDNYYYDGLAAILSDRKYGKLSEVLEGLHDENGVFTVDEGPLHDYKKEYPFSSSDNYFAGILRLICAFHNSYGGAIIFGVRDDTRLAGSNKVKVDSEKINRKLRELLSRKIEITVHEYETPSGSVQVLVVPVRAAMSPPVYVIKKIGDQSPRRVFIRKGAEVLEARGGDLPFLYSERIGALLNGDTPDTSIPASLPPSPATIQEFVGRFYAVETIIEWIGNSRDPRMFLWGQGGSGKSTIAYEAASLIAESGRLVKNKLGKPLERVLFISGKAAYLDPHSGRIVEFADRDFHDGLDIFKAILNLSGWTDKKTVESYTRDQALDALEELFELESLFIVIDDVDTLTTSNVDAGMEELFLVLSRCHSGTKVLYTLRGFPSFAPNAAVEVPGLQKDEFEQFVLLCCRKFSVDYPSTTESEWIAEQSEGRPLAIETIIAMRRITSSYGEAFQRWREKSSEARDYLFSREYQQLARDDRGRHLLAALSIFQTPQSFEALRNVLQFSEEQLQDAIAETRDMFLRVSMSRADDGDSYTIGAATRLFVLEASKQLDKFLTIEARVHHVNTSFGSSPAAYIPIMDRASRSLQGGNASSAIDLLTKKDFPPAFREHPEVQALLGQAYSSTRPPKIIEARQCFQNAFVLGHRHYKMYLNWLELEKNNRTEVVNGIEICQKVACGDGFDKKSKATFLGRLARLQVLRAKDLEMTAPHEAIQLYGESVLSNIRAFSIIDEIKDSAFLLFRERADNSISIALRSALRRDDFDFYFDTFEAILSEGCCLDEFSETLSSRLPEINSRRPNSWKPIVARLNRLMGQVRKVKSNILSIENQATLRQSIDLTLAKARVG